MGSMYDEVVGWMCEGDRGENEKKEKEGAWEMERRGARQKERQKIDRKMRERRRGGDIEGERTREEK